MAGSAKHPVRQENVEHREHSVFADKDGAGKLANALWSDSERRHTIPVGGQKYIAAPGGP